MTNRNETLRRISTDIFGAAINEAAMRFAVLIQEGRIEPLYLSEEEYATGAWNLPKVYAKLLLQVRDEYIANEGYELSAAQIRHALLQGALKAERLFVDGQPLREEPRVRQVTHWVARSGRRIRHSRRQDAKTAAQSRQLN